MLVGFQTLRTLEAVMVVLGNLERHLAELEKSLTDKKAVVGWFPTAVYPSGEPVALVAAKNEFGDRITPPRPFIRPTISDKKNEWSEILGHLIKQGRTGEESLELVALKMQGDINSAIIEVTEPELAESTLATRKKRGNSSDKPLNDTGYMMATLIGVVE